MGDRWAEGLPEEVTVSAPETTAPGRRIVLSVPFFQWRRRSPLECKRCGASVVDERQHASWHASVDAHATVRPDCMRPEGTPHRSFVVHIGENGWPL